MKQNNEATEPAVELIPGVCDSPLHNAPGFLWLSSLIPVTVLQMLEVSTLQLCRRLPWPSNK